MQHLIRGVGYGLLGGAVGLAAMELAQRLAAPLVRQREPQPTDVFLTERTMSPLGPRHHPDESATDALGRIVFERVAHRRPSASTKRALSWGVHLGYGLVVAGIYGALRALLRDHGGARRDRSMRALRDGALFGGGLWLLGDELAVPLLGLSDKPTAYHPTRHLSSLVGHLGFGVATAQTTQLLEARR